MSATKTATVNYTPELTARVLESYASGMSPEDIGAMIGRSTRSVVAKLSREGVYKKKEYVSKTGEKPVKKDNLADAIGAVLRLTESETESLAKANKSALKKVFDALANSKPIEE